MTARATDRLRDLFIIPDFDNARAVVTFTAPRGLTKGTWAITAGREKKGSGTFYAQHPKDRSGKRAPIPSFPTKTRGQVAFEAPLRDFTPWSVDHPFLYRLTLTLTVKGERRQIIQDFGMRKFHVANQQIYMNNRPFYIRGVIRGREAHDHANLLGLPETEYYAKFIRAAKQLGFNFIRFHSRVPSEAYFEAADRLGILTHVEVRKYYGKYQAERDLLDHDPVLVKEQEWVEAILRTRNHPSLMVYCLGNEINTPGRTPEVKARAATLRRLDPTRLFIDTCARGEYDRTGIDLDVQHMGYFAPFGRHDHMFDTSENWAIFGSVKGREMVAKTPGAVTRREVAVNFPVVAHEVGHYLVHRDLDALKRKFAESPADEPWWIDELIKLRRLKGLERDYPKLLQASARFQFIWHKQVFESIRKSPILRGFNFLQLADTERYENANGLLDCFDDIKDTVAPAAYLAFNSDAVLVADLPRRTFFEGETLTIPIWLSNCSPSLGGEGTLAWSLHARGAKRSLRSGRLAQVEIAGGLSRLATVEIALPESERAQPLVFEVSLSSGPRTPHSAIRNSWNLWLYPNRPEALAIKRATVALDGIGLTRRYPQLNLVGSLRRPDRLLITNRFTETVFRHLDRGGDVLMLYRVPETRDRQAKRERYSMPATWDRFKPVIWDRGHNLGGFLRPHRAVKGFPTDGFIDFQFAGLIDDCDKINLDGFPVAVAPIVQGADKAVRDRYDVFTFKLRELQPDWTMRNFAYLFDLRVGKGRLMMSGFNFTGVNDGVPEACAMFESLAACVASPSWRPKTAIPVEVLKRYLARKGRGPRIKERMMTQYWQFDAEPLESAQYWKDAEAWIRRHP